MHVRIVVLSVLLSFTCGCFPYHYTRTPGARGKVLDESSQPIEGASVELSFPTYLSSPNGPKRQPATQPFANFLTDANGDFDSEPTKYWGPMLVGQDVFGRMMVCTVKKSGYMPIEQEHYWSIAGRDKVEIGTLVLKRE